MAIISTDIYQVTPNRTLGIGCVEGKCSCPVNNSGLGGLGASGDNVSAFDITKSLVAPIPGSTVGIDIAQGLANWDITNSWYCNSTMGQLFSPVTCHIPSVAEVNRSWAEELATTGAPKSAIDAALASGAATVQLDMNARPQDYINQNVASGYPIIGSLLGPELTGTLFGMTPGGMPSSSAISPWLIYGGLALGVLFLVRTIKS